MKTCSRCKKSKLPSEFNKNKTRYDGLHSLCKPCNREYLKEHYKKNKKYYHRKAHKHSKKLLEEVRKYKADNPCTDCKSYFPAVAMDFDHIRGEKKSNISQMCTDGKSKAVKEELKKCELVCSNCHRIRTWKRRNIPLSSNG